MERRPPAAQLALEDGAFIFPFATPGSAWNPLASPSARPWNKEGIVMGRIPVRQAFLSSRGVR